MLLKNEGALKVAVVRCFVRHRATGASLWWVKIAAGPFQIPGLPDVICGVAGRFFALELKHPDGSGTLSPKQSACLRALSAAGAATLIAISVVEVETMLTTLLASPARWRSPEREESVGA